MKLRLKFRNSFHLVTLESNAPLSSVLSVCSEAFKIEQSNVQLSLNAKDYFGLEDSTRTLSALGIVSGDILYVSSLEKLDDIKECVERQLASRITDTICTLSSPPRTVCAWISVVLIVLLEDKGLHPTIKFSEQMVGCSEDIIRLKVVYGAHPNVHCVFAVYRTGNFINIACGVKTLNTRCQLMLPIIEYVVPSILATKDPSITPKAVFRNMQTLAIRIKDELIEPVLVAVHAELGLPQRLSLYTMPSELLTRVLLLLPLSALGKLMLTSSFMHRQIINCTPVWRMHLRRLNAKKQLLLDAALTRQQIQRQQQREQEQHAQSTSTAENNTACIGAGNVLSDTQNATDVALNLPSISEESGLSDVEPSNLEPCQYYQRFVARYRSLLTQRRCRGLSPSFV